MKKLHALLPNLLSWSEGPFTEPSYGKEAWLKVFPSLEGVDDLDQMEQFKTFAWLGAVDDRKAIKVKMQQLLEKLTSGGDTAAEPGEVAKGGNGGTGGSAKAKAGAKAGAKAAPAKASGSVAPKAGAKAAP